MSDAAAAAARPVSLPTIGSPAPEINANSTHGPRGRHARGAVLHPLRTLPAAVAALPAGREDEVLVICKTGGRSAAAAEFLIEQGFRRVFSVEGGTDRWAAEGLPVEP